VSHIGRKKRQFGVDVSAFFVPLEEPVHSKGVPHGMEGHPAKDCVTFEPFRLIDTDGFAHMSEAFAEFPWVKSVPLKVDEQRSVWMQVAVFGTELIEIFEDEFACTLVERNDAGLVKLCVSYDE
jgi:hypothetical protein